MEWVRAAHPEWHVLIVPGGFTAELQPADISIQQKHIINKPMQFFAQSVCRDETVLDLRLSTMKRLMACWVLLRGGEKDEHHNESLAPPMDIRRGTKACGESNSRAHQ